MEYRRGGGFSGTVIVFGLLSAVLTASGWAGLASTHTTWAGPIDQYLSLYQVAMDRVLSPFATALQTQFPYWAPHVVALWTGFGMGMSVIVLGAFAYVPEDGHTRSGFMVWLISILIAPIAFVVIALATVKEAYTRALLALAIAMGIVIGPFGLLLAINTQLA